MQMKPLRDIGKRRWSTEHLPCREGTRTLANDGGAIALALMRTLNYWVLHTYARACSYRRAQADKHELGQSAQPCSRVTRCIRRLASVRTRSRDAVGIGSPIALGTDPPSPPVPPLSRSVGDAGGCRGCSPGGTAWARAGPGPAGSAAQPRSRCGVAGGRFAPGLPFRAGRSAAVPPLEGSHILKKPPGPTPPPPARG